MSDTYITVIYHVMSQTILYIKKCYKLKNNKMKRQINVKISS